MAYNVLDLHSVLCLSIRFIYLFFCFSLVGGFSLESCPKGGLLLNLLNAAAMLLPQQRFL